MIVWLIFAVLMAGGLLLSLRLRKNIAAKIEAEKIEVKSDNDDTNK